MNVLLQTRCGCIKGTTLDVSVTPANIIVKLPFNEELTLPDDTFDFDTMKPIERKFTYIGTTQGDNRPMYMETIDQPGYRVQLPLATKAESDQDQQESE